MLKKNNQFDFLKKGFTYEKESLKEPRKKNDQVKASFYAVLIVSLFILGLSLFYLMGAAPQQDNFFSRFFKASLRYSWNLAKLEAFAKLCVALFFVSLTGIILNLQRLKRKGDMFDYFNLFTVIYAVGGIIFYLLMRS